MSAWRAKEWPGLSLVERGHAWVMLCACGARTILPNPRSGAEWDYLTEFVHDHAVDCNAARGLS